VLPHISWFAYLVLVRMVLGRALVTRVMGLDRAGVYFSRRSYCFDSVCGIRSQCLDVQFLFAWCSVGSAGSTLTGGVCPVACLV
jgi:multisubunit Na+/H+ antiporter MnhF subunit